MFGFVFELPFERCAAVNPFGMKDRPASGRASIAGFNVRTRLKLASVVGIKGFFAHKKKPTPLGSP